MRLNRRRFLGSQLAIVAGGAGLWTFGEKSFGAPAREGRDRRGRRGEEEESTPEQGEHGPVIGEKVKSRYQLGISITAKVGNCVGLEGCAPMPISWPEQEVRVVEEDISAGVQSAYREVSSTVHQLVLSVPQLSAGNEVHALLTVEIERAPLTAPSDTTTLKVPAKVTKPDLKMYLKASPGIETAKSKFRDIAKEATADKSSAWEQVEALYDWTREHIAYVNGPFKGAWRALNDGDGDCEELSSVFIALCRCHGVPARTVWVPDHCYPEFYLEDDKGIGYWFPCQAAGSRDFGGIPELKPILQKGDNFILPGEKAPVRYVAEKLTGKGGKPSVKFIRKQLDADV